MPTAVKPETSAGFDHVAGEARVLADHDAVAVIAVGEDAAGGHAHFEGNLRRHRVRVGETPDAVGAKQVTLHSRFRLPKALSASGILKVKSNTRAGPPTARFLALSAS